MIKEFLKDLICINSMVINLCSIVFEGNVLVGKIKYSVRLIWVVEGVFIVFLLDGVKFGMFFLGV